jgi:hypothetical protein
MPIQLEPYRNPEATTIANLIGGADRARASAMTAAADATARGAQSVGEQAGATLNNLVKLKLDEPRRQLEGIHLREAQLSEKDDLAARDAFSHANGDPDAAVTLLERQGNYPVAMKLRGQLAADRLRGLDSLNKQLEVNEKRLSQASQLLQSVTLAPTPEAAAAQYRDVLPSVRSIVGAELGSKLPNEYDPNVVKQAMTWGMKASDVLRMQRDSATTALEGVRTAVTKVELDATLTQSLAKAAQTAESQADWDRIRSAAITWAGNDIGGTVLAKFPEQWSPQVKTVAQKFLVSDAFAKTDMVSYTGPDGKAHITEAAWDKTTNQWFAAGDTTTPLANVRKFEKPSADGKINVQEYADALMKDPSFYHKLTDTAITQVMPELVRRGFTIPPPTTRDPGTAIRWRARALSDLDKERRDEARMPGPMTVDEFNAKKDAIEQSYQLQVGQTPAAARPAAPPTPAAGAPKATSPAAPKARTNPNGPITITIPGKGPITFPSQQKLDEFLRASGMTLVPK